MASFFLLLLMKKLKVVVAWIFTIILVVAGINHVIHPAMYSPFIPGFLPLNATNYFTAVVEITLGVGLAIPATQRIAAISTTLLMIFFLPFHMVDAFREHPAIGTHLVAWIRLALQFVMIYGAWLLVPKAR